jgi:hypothetical protein
MPLALCRDPDIAKMLADRKGEENRNSSNECRWRWIEAVGCQLIQRNMDLSHRLVYKIHRDMDSMRFPALLRMHSLSGYGVFTYAAASGCWVAGSWLPAVLTLETVMQQFAHKFAYNTSTSHSSIVIFLCHHYRLQAR